MPQTPTRGMPSDAMKFRGTPRFALSGETEEIVEAIRKLKGIVCSEDEKAERLYTHFLSDGPNRGQNTFACIVAGKWMLSMNYVIDSVKAGYFLDVSISC